MDDLTLSTNIAIFLAWCETQNIHLVGEDYILSREEVRELTDKWLSSGTEG